MTKSNQISRTKGRAYGLGEKKLGEYAWHEVLARITPGYVHEVNNCLAASLALSETCLLLKESRSFEEEFATIKKTTYQAAQLLQSLMGLHHQLPGKTGYHDLNAITRETVEILRKFLKRRLELEVHLPAEPLPVLVDEVELKRSILFLVVSATDAMPERGRIAFRAAAAECLESPAGFVGRWPKPPYTCLDLVDNAPRLDPGLLDWDLEKDLPDDATAQSLKLRLHCARRAIENAGGVLSLEAAAGAGNLFRIVLPRADLTSAPGTE